MRQMNTEETHAWYRRGRWPCCEGTGYLGGPREADMVRIMCPRCGTVMQVVDPANREHWGAIKPGHMLAVPKGYTPRPIPLLWRIHDFVFFEAR